jgi:sulfur carrier protein ThiS
MRINISYMAQNATLEFPEGTTGAQLLASDKVRTVFGLDGSKKHSLSIGGGVVDNHTELEDGDVVTISTVADAKGSAVVGVSINYMAQQASLSFVEGTTVAQMLASDKVRTVFGLDSSKKHSVAIGGAVVDNHTALMDGDSLTISTVADAKGN